MKKNKIKYRIAFPAAAMLVILTAGGRGEYAAAILIAAGLHECGHLLTAALLKIKLTSFSIDLFGARIGTAGTLLSYGDEILLCISGPIFNFLLFFYLYPISIMTGGAGGEFLLMVSAVSLCLGILNLLPVSSFDGGRILYCIISALTDDNKAYNISRFLSFVTVFMLWMCSVYLLLKTGSSLSLFVFSISLFARMFF